ncbi:hypothetical protein Q7A53_16615 [Halobacillus rhizosphaerae]|uniref:hypothetical protein n=1 Tax=Halobacillus rhizosphaerae TaxID=3064889 RepID=UPI00398B3106
MSSSTSINYTYVFTETILNKMSKRLGLYAKGSSLQSIYSNNIESIRNLNTQPSKKNTVHFEDFSRVIWDDVKAINYFVVPEDSQTKFPQLTAILDYCYERNIPIQLLAYHNFGLSFDFGTNNPVDPDLGIFAGASLNEGFDLDKYIRGHMLKLTSEFLPEEEANATYHITFSSLDDSLGFRVPR